MQILFTAVLLIFGLSPLAATPQASGAPRSQQPQGALPAAKLSLPQGAAPQQTPAPSTSPIFSDEELSRQIEKLSFLDLADLKGNLKGEIDLLDKEIQQDEKDVANIDYLKAQLAEAKLHEEPPQQNPQAARLFPGPPSSFFQQQLDSAKRKAEGLPAKRRDLTNKKNLQRLVQHRIVTILSPEQKYKQEMSFAFAGLIACVIIGFFVLAFMDEGVRRTIFAGEAGIQFLTLFSLVIAIILFGITGILEAKELAALLGGLSGYILGRGTNRPPKRDQNEEG